MKNVFILFRTLVGRNIRKEVYSRPRFQINEQMNDKDIEI